MANVHERIQQDFIEALENSEKTPDELIEELVPCYAKGYMMAKAETMLQGLSSDDDEFRELILKIAKYDIWK